MSEELPDVIQGMTPVHVTKQLVGALQRIYAAADSDADLQKLPALRDFLKQEAGQALHLLDHDPPGQPSAERKG